MTSPGPGAEDFAYVVTQFELRSVMLAGLDNSSTVDTRVHAPHIDSIFNSVHHPFLNTPLSCLQTSSSSLTRSDKDVRPASTNLKHNLDAESIKMDHDPPHRPQKRPKLDGITTSETHVQPQTILNYATDEEGTDDTYSDSDGTEQDFVDDPYSRYASLGPSDDERPPWQRSEAVSSEEESNADDSEQGTPWSTIPDFNDSLSDSDYKPPSWNLEDIWEIHQETPRYDARTGIMITHPLDDFSYANEFMECGGFMSPCGLSTDDSDEGYDPGIARRPSGLPIFVGSCRFVESSLDSTPIRWVDTYEDYECLQTMAQNSRRFESRRRKWEMQVKPRLLDDQFLPLDLEQRLSDILYSDQATFDFDDEECRYLERFA